MIWLLLILIGCESAAEVRAKEWIRNRPATIAAPIHTLACENWEPDKEGRVTCIVKVELKPRIFSHKLKCYNSNRPITDEADCIEVSDE